LHRYPSSKIVTVHRSCQEVAGGEESISDIKYQTPQIKLVSVLAAVQESLGHPESLEGKVFMSSAERIGNYMHPLSTQVQQISFHVSAILVMFQDGFKKLTDPTGTNP
jgi:hypothetical protein